MIAMTGRQQTGRARRWATRWRAAAATVAEHCGQVRVEHVIGMSDITPTSSRRRTHRPYNRRFDCVVIAPAVQRASRSLAV